MTTTSNTTTAASLLIVSPIREQDLTDAELCDFAGEQFAPPQEPSPIERQLRASVEFVQHPTFENFSALRRVIGGTR